MIGLFSMKRKFDEDKMTKIKRRKRISGAEIRIQKDINDFQLPKACKTKPKNGFYTLKSLPILL